jgi:DNA primase
MPMRYSEDLIEEVRSKNDIVDVIGEVVKLKRAGSNYVGLCPFHNEKTPSFSVSRSKQMFYCFGCHEGGNVITFVMEYNQYTFIEALQYLADRAGVSLPKMEYSKEAMEQADRKSRLFEINSKAAAYFYYKLRSEAGKYGYAYLTGRGLTEETIKKFGLGYSDKFSDDLYRYLKSKGYADELLNESGLFMVSEKSGMTDKFWNRVMFPIFDVSGKVIGFGGRVMGDGKPKYLNSPETLLFNKRNNLYALNFARTSRNKKIILCEGYMDVITMHQAGFTNAVASLGTALTSQQANLLKRYTSEVLLLYDSDEAGQMAAMRAIPILKEAGIDSRVVDLTPHKDPDEFVKAEGFDALNARLEGASSSFMFEAATLAKDYSLSDPQSLTAFEEKLSERLLEIPAELERNNYLEALSRKYGIPSELLRRQVNTLALRGTPAEHYERPKSGTQKREEPGQGILQSQKMMLTYLANYPEAFRETKGLITPEDFTDPLCRSIAEGLYRQQEQGGVNQAQLLNGFADAEAQKQIAGMFHASVEVENEAEQDRAFTDTVLKLMNNSNEEQLKSWDGRDAAVLKKLISEKNEIEAFEKGGKMLHLPYENSGDNKGE